LEHKISLSKEDFSSPIKPGKKGGIVRFFSFFRRKNSSEKKNSSAIGKNNWSKRQNRLDRKLVSSLNEKKIPSFRQLKYISHYLSKKERIISQIAFLVFAASLIFALVRIYQYFTVPVPQSGGEYTEALIGAPKYINPILSQTNDTDMDLARLTFSGLMKVSPDQELVSDLAERYEISEDHKAYTFYLRKDVRFHDGDDLTADDVIFTFESIQDPEFKSPLYLNFKGVGIERVDDYTVRFILQEPFIPFLSSLTFGILPVHIWQEVPPENASLADYNLRPVGSGPYQFKSLVKDKNGNIKSYELVRYDNYYANIPHIEKLYFKFYPDVNSALDSIENKNVDGISFVPNDKKEEIEKKNSKVNYQALRLPQYTAIFFNQENKLLKTKEVREALALSVDKEKIIREALNGEGDIIHGPILPGYIGYNPEIKKYQFDLEAAKKELEDAGWVYPETAEGEPPAQVRAKNGAELAFAISTIDQPEYLKTVEIIEEAWEAIGVHVETKIYSAKDVQKKVIKTRAYEALLFGEIIGTDPDPYPFWHSSQSRDPGLNLAVFYNKDIDQLLEEARKTNDEEQRRLKYLHFQNILADEIPAIFLYNPIYTYGLNNKIKGSEGRYITVPSDRFSGVENWYIKTKRIWK